jgi:hypothetical protein
MKNIITIILIFAVNLNFAQSKKTEKISFETVIDINNATKDGIYINGYVVNISYSDLVKLNKKKVKITGIVTIEKRLNEEDNKNFKKEKIICQGRQKDTKYIEKPKIEIVN